MVSVIYGIQKVEFIKVENRTVFTRAWESREEREKGKCINVYQSIVRKINSNILLLSIMTIDNCNVYISKN